MLLDAGQGSAIARAQPAMEEAFDAGLARTQARRAEFAAMRDLPPITSDGTRITVMVNAGLRDDVAALDTTGADGIGLFRTEFEFLVSAQFPKRERQQRVYRDIIEAAGDKPVVFRTVDIGGDKILPYMTPDAEDEENPAMGWRALRLGARSRRPDEGAGRGAGRRGGGAGAARHVPDGVRTVGIRSGARIGRGSPRGGGGTWQGYTAVGPLWRDAGGAGVGRKPRSAAAQARLPVDRHNDLTQFLFAADRAHPRLAERYDWLSPSILRFLARVTRESNAARVPVSVCGEMGGRPLEAMALLGLGIERLSITPAAVGPIKAMVRSLDLGRLRAAMTEWLALPPPDMRAALTEWAEANGVRVS